MRTYYWQEGQNDNPFKSPFLGQFILTDTGLHIPDQAILSLDGEVSHFEHRINTDVRAALISRNELLTSFAIAKAEKTNKLTIEEMRQIRASLGDSTYREEYANLPPRKAHDTIEYANILETYRWSLEKDNVTADNLSIDLIQRVHRGLTRGLDPYGDKITFGFAPYNPGTLRDNDEIRVDTYRPVDAKDITSELNELIKTYRENRSLENLLLFHAGLYAIHPFNNGNKRLCRILEHALLRDLGLNQSNIYSHSYFYYRQMGRFYSTLLKGLLSKNFTPIVNFSREALFFSQLDVFRTSVEHQRKNFVKQMTAGMKVNETQSKIHTALVKSKEIQFKRIVKIAKKVSDRTVAEYLRQGIEQGLLEKHDRGKFSYYSLRLDVDEEHFIKERVSKYAGKVNILPEQFLASIYRKNENWREVGKAPDSDGASDEPEETETRGISP